MLGFLLPEYSAAIIGERDREREVVLKWLVMVMVKRGREMGMKEKIKSSNVW